MFERHILWFMLDGQSRWLQDESVIFVALKRYRSTRRPRQVGGWAPLSKLVRDKSVVCTCQMEKKRVVTHGPLCRRTDFSFLAQMYTFVTT